MFRNKKYKYLLFCGDIHGNLDIIPNFIKNNDLEDVAIFQVGDFGIGFENKIKEERRLEYLNERMAKYSSTLFAIRGNHDDPLYFNGDYYLSNVILMKDYSIININDWKILGIGGAISVDRSQRKGFISKKGSDWWEGEKFNYKPDILEEINDIDIVCTHTAPSCAEPFTINSFLYNFILYDYKLEDDLKEERDILNNVYKILNKNNYIKYWYYGHFHKNENKKHNNTEFNCLNINKIIENIKFYFPD